jgi:hypothetical protein
VPVRLRHNRRRRTTHITPEAVALFREGLAQPSQAIRIALAAALGRSKFRASPIDREPKSLIGCDREPIEEVLHLRAQLLKSVGPRYLP